MGIEQFVLTLLANIVHQQMTAIAHKLAVS
jgi:hypothetical protein